MEYSAVINMFKESVNEKFFNCFQDALNYNFSQNRTVLTGPFDFMRIFYLLKEKGKIPFVGLIQENIYSRSWFTILNKIPFSTCINIFEELITLVFPGAVFLIAVNTPGVVTLIVTALDLKKTFLLTRAITAMDTKYVTTLSGDWTKEENKFIVNVSLPLQLTSQELAQALKMFLPCNFELEIRYQLV
jgi:hypothetical protein